MKSLLLIFSIFLLSSCAILVVNKVAPEVYLKNGDTFNLSAEMIKHKVNGKIIEMMGYNGTIPGPNIFVEQGSEIIVHFTNNLNLDTTVHPHGLKVDNKFDGLPHITQDPIKPGESFDYTFRFVDPGVYWYHSHIREDITQEMGLYGNFIVKPKELDYFPEVNREIPLILDDILLTDDGDHFPFEQYTTHTLMGRYGNHLFINGEDDIHIEAKRNEVIRLYITDTANARPFNLSIPGIKMKKIASDLSRYENEEFINSLIIAPAERYIVDILLDMPGEFTIQSMERIIGKIIVSEETIEEDFSQSFLKLRKNLDILGSFDPKKYLDTPADKTLLLTLNMKKEIKDWMLMLDMPCHQMPSGQWMGNCDDEDKEFADHEEEKIEFEDNMPKLNSMSNDKNTNWILRDMETGREGKDIVWTFDKDEVVKMKFINTLDSDHPMQHPIHMHGQEFLILSINGEYQENQVWKDTVLVPAGDEIEILSRMINPGIWVMHCHIAEHMHSGMTLTFKVLD